MHLHNEHIRFALGYLFKDVPQSYSVAYDVQGNVTIDLKEISFGHALETMLKQVDATYRIDKGVWKIMRRPQNICTLGFPEVTLAVPPGITYGSDPYLIRVLGRAKKPKRERPPNPMLPAVHFVNQDIRDVLRSIFKEIQGRYGMASDVEGKVTIYMKRVRLLRALDAILKQVHSTWRVESGVFQFLLKPTKTEEDAARRREDWIIVRPAPGPPKPQR